MGPRRKWEFSVIFSISPVLYWYPVSHLLRGQTWLQTRDQWSICEDSGKASHQDAITYQLMPRGSWISLPLLKGAERGSPLERKGREGTRAGCWKESGSHLESGRAEMEPEYGFTAA